MAIKEVQVLVSEVKNLLSQGYTWYKKDDLGYGSIQEKYNAKDIQIATIRKHPALEKLETDIVIFQIIDDTKPVAQPIIEKKEEVKSSQPVLDTQDDFSAFQEL